MMNASDYLRAARQRGPLTFVDISRHVRKIMRRRMRKMLKSFGVFSRDTVMIRSRHAIWLPAFHDADWRGNANVPGPVPAAQAMLLADSAVASSITDGEGGDGGSGGPPDEGEGDDDPEPPMPGVPAPGDQGPQSPRGNWRFLLIFALVLLFLPPYLYGFARFADSLPHVSAGAAIAFASLAAMHFKLLHWLCRSLIAMTERLERHRPSDDNDQVKG